MLAIHDDDTLEAVDEALAHIAAHIHAHPEDVGALATIDMLLDHRLVLSA